MNSTDFFSIEAFPDDEAKTVNVLVFGHFRLWCQNFISFGTVLIGRYHRSVTFGFKWRKISKKNDDY